MIQHSVVSQQKPPDRRTQMSIARKMARRSKKVEENENLKIAEKYSKMYYGLLNPGGVHIEDESNIPLSDREAILKIYNQVYDKVEIRDGAVLCYKAEA